MRSQGKLVLLASDSHCCAVEGVHVGGRVVNFADHHESDFWGGLEGPGDTPRWFHERLRVAASSCRPVLYFAFDLPRLRLGDGEPWLTPKRLTLENRG